MTKTQTQTQTHPRYLVGFQSDRATAANAALWAGQEIFEEARKAWARVREALGTTFPMKAIDDAEPVEVALRRNAVALEKAAGTTLGVASSSACGLWGLTDEGRIFEVDATDSGSEYLRGVVFVAVATQAPGFSGEFVPTMERTGDEFPVRNVVAFVDSYADAHNLRISLRR